MLISYCDIVVRYAETDQMGVVHHSNYPIYFEHGRTLFFEEHLVGYQEFEAQGLFCPVLSYSVSLLGKLSYGHTLRLETFPSAFRGLKVSMAYRGFQGDKMIVEGETTHAITGPNLRPLHPRNLPELYQRLKERFTDSLVIK